jgi:glycosyltransferase involved in cell wall biosynthesis
MPCYNSEIYLRDAIKSVVDQTYQEWELIIVNDFSVDSSLEIINAFQKIDSRIICINNTQNIGVALSRNEAVKISKGKYIAFLDSDDSWFKEKLETQVSFMLINSIAISFTQYNRINSNSKIVGCIDSLPKSVDYKRMLKGNDMAMSTSMFDQEVIGKHYFLKIGHEDYYYWLSLMRKGYIALPINKLLVNYRVHSNSISSNKLKAISFTWCIYTKVLKLNFFEASYFFLIHVFTAVRKRI